MKTIAQYTLLLVLLFSIQNLFSQENKEQQIDSLRVQKERILIDEKALLKEEVRAIKLKLENKEITEVAADSLKQKAAMKGALNIENRTVIIDNQIALLERNDNVYIKEYTVFGITVKNIERESRIVFSDKERPIRYDKRTTSDFVLAIGFNNAILEGETLDDSPYKFYGSRFFEMGWAWKTRLFSNSNALRLKYGFSFQWNGLKLTDNRYFVQDGNETTFEVYPQPTKKAKLNITNLIFPTHLEFGPSKKTETNNYLRYSTKRQFKMGLGVYFGFNLGTYQKIKYIENGDKNKEKIKKDYNTSDLVYGLSGYLAFNDVALYARYELSPLFEDQVQDQNTIALGIRFDMN